MLSSYACEQSLVMWIEIIYSKDFDLLTLCSLYKKAMPDSSTMTTFGIPGTLLHLDRHVLLKVGGKIMFPCILANYHLFVFYMNEFVSFI